MAPKEIHDPNAEAGVQMGAHASVVPEEKDNVPIEKPLEKRTYKRPRRCESPCEEIFPYTKKPTKAITTRNRLCNCDCMFDSIDL